MPRTNLKQSAQKRAANKVASKVAKTTKAKTDSKTAPSPTTALASPGISTATSTTSKPVTATTTTANNAAVVVPSLPGLSPSSVAGMLPQFDEESYSISDPLNPAETPPPVTEPQFNKSEAIYQGTLRALKLTGMAFDVADTRFTVIGKRAKAFGSGIRAATAVERVRGDYLDYQTQLETTAQKTVTLDMAQAKTVNDRAASVHAQSEMDEKLEQAKTSADLARQKTAEKQNQLVEFKKSLGEYLPAK